MDEKERIHIVPVNDEREHELTIDCACRPGIAKGKAGKVVLHFPRP